MFKRLETDFQGRHFEGHKVAAVGAATILATLALIRNYMVGGKCRIKKNLSGKVAVVTGGNTGIGKETARTLAEYGCKVIIGSRDVKKNAETVDEISKQFPHSSITSSRLDLGDKASIVNFAEFVREEVGKDAETNRVDFLINNAGVMAVPERRLTRDGFEMQIGINHFGHFFLTYHLWPFLKKSHNPRVINLSSLGHGLGGEKFKIDFNNIFYENGGYG